MAINQEKKLRVGDFVRPRMSGIMEPGDPAYTVESITEDNKFTIVQKIGSYEHRMTLPREKLKRL